MPIVNYVREHIRFMEYATDEHLTASERLLWYALMHIFNQRAQGRVWPEEFIRISNDRLLSYCPMKYDTIASARNSLKQRGLIDFQKGDKNKLSPSYRINYFFPEYAAPGSEADGVYTRCNTEKSDNTGGNMGDNTGGNIGGNTGGNTGDIYINYTEEIRGTVRKPGRDDDNTGIVRARAGDEIGLMLVRTWLRQNPDVRALFGADMDAAEALLESGRYPAEMVGKAMSVTFERHRRGGLTRPMDYMRTLLQDWENSGLKTAEQVEDAHEAYLAGE